MALKRTAKACGPGAPTLVSSLREMTCRRRWQKSPVTGYSIHTFWSLRVVPYLIRRKASRPNRMTFGPGFP